MTEQENKPGTPKAAAKPDAIKPIEMKVGENHRVDGLARGSYKNVSVKSERDGVFIISATPVVTLRAKWACDAELIITRNDKSEEKVKITAA